MNKIRSKSLTKADFPSWIHRDSEISLVSLTELKLVFCFLESDLFDLARYILTKPYNAYVLIIIEASMGE